MSNLLKNLIIALGITVILGVVYVVFIKNDEEAIIDDGAMLVSTGEAGQVIEKILDDTQKIDRYALDESIFTDLNFVSLKDFRVEVPDVKTGRINPFEAVQ